jgi:hypothetical protein
VQPFHAVTVPRRFPNPLLREVLGATQGGAVVRDRAPAVQRRATDG